MLVLPEYEKMEIAVVVHGTTSRRHSTCPWPVKSKTRKYELGKQIKKGIYES